MNRVARGNWQGRGFTLIEILMTIVVIGILATVALRSLQSGIDQTRITETQNEMDELVMAIAGNPNLYANGLRSDFGYVGDVGSAPSSLDNLITNPGSYTTWKGPYVGRRFTEDPDGYKKDAWGNLYTFTSGITISSTGGGVTAMTKSATSASGDLTSTPVTGTVTDAAGNPPGDSSVAVTVRITYPNGTGGTTSATATPNSGGAFSISGIPVGNHTITAVYRATNDTATTLASSLPKAGASVNLRFPGSPFAASGGGSGGGSVIQFVPGTAVVSGPTDDVSFGITNTGGSGLMITSLVATYSHTPTAWYENVRWGSTTVFSSTNPRKASGQSVTFSVAQGMAPGAVVTMQLLNFRNAISGGSAVNITGTNFTITFSNGNSITFSI
jgi:prepilin-type N-terminal cleavage/methylation domain-containing protein